MPSGYKIAALYTANMNFYEMNMPCSCVVIAMLFMFWWEQMSATVAVGWGHMVGTRIKETMRMPWLLMATTWSEVPPHKRIAGTCIHKFD